MDGLFHGKPYEQMDDLGVFPYFWSNTHVAISLKNLGGGFKVYFWRQTFGEMIQVIEGSWKTPLTLNYTPEI